MNLTTSAKSQEAQREWLVIDAENQPLGRLSSVVAKMLRGKHKPSFTPHADMGDNIIVINAEKVRLTGRKKEQMTHYWHTNHPGGIKSITAEKELGGRHPQRLIERSVTRMMPKESPLARDMMRKLHVYAGENHPHQAQKPKAFDLGSLINKA